MQYTIRENYNNFKIWEENKLLPRAYFVPFESFENCVKTKFYEERQNSKLLTMLNGQWDFIFYDKISKLGKTFDSDNVCYDKIDVPSCWQYRGYEKPFYVNAKYMFDCFPPNVPSDEGTCGKTFALNNGNKIETVFNTCGVYRKVFNYAPSVKEIITFLGVSSCLELYLNGSYIGYSEGSHNTAEFDISAQLKSGQNEIVAVVYKWCNGTYLECQDMFRNNGIFRDVYITALGENYIYDYAIKTTQVSKNTWNLNVDIVSNKSDDTQVVYELFYGENKLKTNQPSGDNFDCNIEDVKLWSAEQPNLYTLFIKLVMNGKTISCIRQEVGFKVIKINGNIFYFNGKAIKIKGVNHHDTNEKNGYVMTAEDIKKDILLMKELNVNAVRTSHYPPDAIFLKMANYYGMYIIDEADIETHGAYAQKLPKPNLISNNSKWKEQFWDRVNRMYFRDRNSVSVIMWSLGNESGGWKNQDYCYDKLKALQTSIPIHYEAVCRTPRFNYDVVSKMYDSTYWIEKYVDKKLPKRNYRAPYFLCEYAHAMGLGAGSLDYYWKLFYKSESLMGGCIWEWADHAVLHNDGSYTYGGDHAEYVHDSNFCVDGIVYPDRTLSTTSYNVQAVYRPISAYYVSNNKYAMRNRNYFVDSSIYEIEWNYLVNGEVVAQGVVQDIILPDSENVITLNHPQMDTLKDCFVNFIYHRKSDGKIIAKEQIILCKNIKSNKIVGKGKACCIEENNLFKIKLDNGQICFDKSSGKIVEYTVGSLSIVGEIGATPSVYRKPIDNFMYVKNRWKKLGLDNAILKLNIIESKNEENCVRVNVAYNIFLKAKLKMRVIVKYFIFGNGVVDVDVELRSKNKYDLPAFGVQFAIPNCYDNIKYYGYGDKENYSDFKAHSLLGIYEAKTSQMYEKYIKPQDSGNHTKVKWLSAKNANGEGIVFRSVDRSLDMSALPYDDEDLMKANHRHELIGGKHTIIKVDGFVRGVGSNSCGEDTRKEFVNHSDVIKYKFQISSLTKDKI